MLNPHDRRDDPKTRLNLIRLRSHRAIARKIDADPSLLDIPLRNLDRWRALRGEDYPACAEWRGRLVRVQNDNTRGATGWCLDPVDLAVAKYVAARHKDLPFTLEMVRRNLIDPDTFARRLDATPIDEAHKRRVARLFEAQRATILREKDR